MQRKENTIPIVSKVLEENNRHPGVVAYTETFDTGNDISEQADVLSFESLREAFATLRSAETELARTIPNIESSTKQESASPEQPDYEIDEASVDFDGYGGALPQNIETSITVDARLETIIEAILFVGNRENRPLNADQIAEKLRNVSAEEVDQTVARLNEHYQERNCPYTIISEHAGYQMILCSEFESVRANFYGKTRETRLSQQAIDTLAVVAYRQPITAEEVQHIRKRPCSAVLSQLVRRNLLKISREKRDKKETVRYHTTSRFLELFQIKSLDDIPKVEELDYR